MPYKRPNSSKWWIIVGGVRQSAGTSSYEDAAALEARLNHQLWMHDKMGVVPPRPWKEAVVRYLQENQHKVSFATTKQRLLWWHDHLGDIDDITKIDRAMIDTALRGNRPVTTHPSPANTTANKYAIVVSAVLNAACRDWGWITSTPRLRRYPEPDHKRDFLTVEQWRTLEAQLPNHLRGPATFALATGMRASKVFELKWKQIDMGRRVMRTTGTANKRGNTIPLNETAMSVLWAAAPYHERVFLYQGRPLANYGKAWYKALDRAELGTYSEWIDEDGTPRTSWEGFTWHGLRHTFASWLGQAGVPETALDQLCGWAEKDTRSTYTHLNVDTLRPHSEVIDRVLSGS